MSERQYRGIKLPLNPLRQLLFLCPRHLPKTETCLPVSVAPNHAAAKSEHSVNSGQGKFCLVYLTSHQFIGALETKTSLADVGGHRTNTKIGTVTAENDGNAS